MALTFMTSGYRTLEATREFSEVYGVESKSIDTASIDWVLQLMIIQNKTKSLISKGE